MVDRPFLLVLALWSGTVAVTAAPLGFPDRLFGIELGKVYDIGRCGRDTGDLPVAKCTGIQFYRGQGNYYYFKPLETYPEFEYIETRETAGDGYHQTSFRLFLLPLVGRMAGGGNRYEVAQIAWRREAPSPEAAYSWALSMCESTREQLPEEPVITNKIQRRLYSCDFVHGQAKLEIDASGGVQYYVLKYNDAVFNRKLDVLESQMQQFDFLKDQD